MRSGSSLQSRMSPRRARPPSLSRELVVGPVESPFWSLRWVEALLRLPGVDAARLERGVLYAREGHVSDLHLEDEKVKAIVSGTRPTPYEVTLKMAPLDDATWDRVVEAIRARPDLRAPLLTGDPTAVPRSIDEVFQPLGVSLFPLRDTDIHPRCSCPDRTPACKHVAAVYSRVGEAIDQDPFLLFELRGRSKEQLLEALGAPSPAPGGGSAPSGAGSGGEASPGGSGAAGEASASRSAGSSRASARSLAEIYERSRAPLVSLRFRFEEPAAHAAILRPLGRPPSWSRPEPIESWLDPTYQAAGQTALELALGTPPPRGPTRGAVRKGGKKG